MNTTKKKYAFLGVNWKLGVIAFIFGSFFPVISWQIVLSKYEIFPSLSGVRIIHFLNPLLWIINAAPFILGGVGYFLAKKVNAQSHKMNEIIREQRDNFANLALYAEKIGKGDLEATYHGKKNDTLGRALVQMSENLKKNREKDNEENWIAVGRDKISTILREALGLEALVYKLLVEILEYTGVVQGAFFVAEGEGETLAEKKKNVKLKLIAHHAYGRKKYTKGEYKLGEGLVGESAIEQNTIHRTELPDDHLTITSGLIADAKPSAILIVPLIAEDNIEGVLELAGFEKFSPLKIRLIEELAVIIARTLYNVKINNKTTRLLHESQTMTTELQEQQATLEENAKEMMLKQEEIQNASERQHTLLENASEIITIYNTKGKIKYISPSVKNILGYQQKELENKAYQSFMIEECAKTFGEMLAEIEKDDTLTKTIHSRYTNKKGEQIWVESTARNKITDSAIQGIVVNSTDITARREAEKEQIMRGKMQALSENSKDIILRFNLDGIFEYVNPAIQGYTGAHPMDLTGISYNDFPFDEVIKEAWGNIIKEVEKEQKLIVKEMDFPVMGSLKIMTVNAIPEFDADKKLESILMVSHDITERKKQEKVLEVTNKKITDSINYARRIQNAIIPQQDVIEQEIGNTAMYYRPKDVVSGDFPYYFNKDGYKYYAAVDCTGHGVPGAMMSLIGHLVLNEILHGDELLEPGEVLNRLHWGVVKTLKQDHPDNKAADGMDVALCRISPDNKEVLYSGAHRPLYHLQNGEVLQYKGDKYPIGGNQYGGKNHFDTHIVDIKKGDAIYFFSDGYPDQFGGPEKLKFGPKRMRKLIVEHKDKSVTEVVNIFQENYEEWVKTYKQIDDVLLIGIEF